MTECRQCINNSLANTDTVTDRWFTFVILVICPINTVFTANERFPMKSLAGSWNPWHRVTAEVSWEKKSAIRMTNHTSQGRYWKWPIKGVEATLYSIPVPKVSVWRKLHSCSEDRNAPLSRADASLLTLLTAPCARGTLINAMETRRPCLARWWRRRDPACWLPGCRQEGRVVVVWRCAPLTSALFFLPTPVLSFFKYKSPTSSLNGSNK